MLIAVSVGNCMDVETRAYIDGYEDGFKLGELAWQARGNNTAVDLYNEEVMKYNAVIKYLLNDNEYRQEELAKIPYINDDDLPPVFRMNSGLWDNTYTVANSSYDLTEEQMEDAGIGLGNESWLGFV